MLDSVYYSEDTEIKVRTCIHRLLMFIEGVTGLVNEFCLFLTMASLND